MLKICVSTSTTPRADCFAFFQKNKFFQIVKLAFWGN